MTLLPLLLASLSPADAGQITPLYQSPVIADGATHVAIQLVIPGIVATDRIRITSYDAEIISQSLNGEVLTVELLPALKDSAGEAELTVKIRGSQKIDEVVSVPMFAEADGAFEITFEPAQVLQGRDEATVRIRPTGNRHLPDAARSIAVSASVGTLTEAVATGEGDWIARYTPPEEMDAPAAALITVTDWTAPESVHGKASLPVMVRRSQSFDTEAGSNNVLVIEDQEYGPLEASPMGSVAFDVDLHPARDVGTLKVAADGEPRQFQVEIETGAQPQLAFAPLPADVKVPAGEALELMLALTNADGSPWGGAKLQGLEVRGTDSPELYEVGGGWYRVTLDVPAAGEWSATATLGEASAQISGAAIPTLPILSISTAPETLEEAPEELTLTVRAKNDQGTALPGQALQVQIDGEGIRDEGELVDNSDGTYTQTLKLRDEVEGLQLSVYNAFTPSGLPASELLIWPVEPGFNAGSGSSLVRVVAVDAFGTPVPNQTVTLGVPLGDGTLPPSVDTGEFGVGLAAYQIGSDTGEVLLRAELNGIVGTYATWQVPASSPLPGWSALGDEGQRAAMQAWRKATPVLRVGQVVAPEIAAAPLTSSATAEAGGTAGAAAATVQASGGAATAGAAGATTASGAGASTAAGAAGGDGLRDLVRVRGALISTGMAYEMKSESDGAGQLPPEAEFGGTRGFGASLRADFWPFRDAYGGDVRIRTAGYKVEAADDLFSDSIADLILAARYRYGLLDDTVHVGGGLGLHRSDTVLFLYEDDKRVEAELQDVPLTGARVAANASALVGPVGPLGSIFFEVEVAETFAPQPIELYVGGNLDVEVWNGVTASLGFNQNFRNVALEIEDDTLDETFDTDVREIRNAVVFGAGYLF